MGKKTIQYSPPPTYNSAHWAADEELEAAGAFVPGSISVGYSLWSRREIFYHPKPGQLRPLIAFGSMGAGKTTSNHIPFSFRWPGSLIILEATCETALVTAHYRKKYGPVYIINPNREYEREFRGLIDIGYNNLAPY